MENLEIDGSNTSLQVIPLHLLFDIFALLPAKTLLVVRAVCKAFLSLTDDPEFVSFHLRRFPGNLRETQFLTIQRPNIKFDYEIREINTSCTTIIQIDEPWIKTGRWSFGGSVDGLVLFLSTHLDGNGSLIPVLFNPSIKKRHQLSFPSSSLEYFGLGYDPYCEDYKVIALSSYHDEAWLYSLKTGSFTKILKSGFRRKFGKWSGYSGCTSFKYGLSWIERKVFSYESKSRMVWFDFESERFRYANKMPKRPKKWIERRFVMLDGGSTVGLWILDKKERASIWALETEGRMKWIKRYNIAPDALPTTGKYVSTLWFVESDGELMWKYWNHDDLSLEILSYDVEMQAIKNHEKYSRFAEEYFCVYSQSLLMLKST